jgi:hypothetical protein
MEEAQRGIPKALFCATVLGSAPWSPQQFLPWVLGHSAGQTRARARGGSAHGGTPSHGLRWLGRHDAAAVSAQTPQDAIWEDLHMWRSSWAELATWGNRGEASNSRS